MGTLKVTSKLNFLACQKEQKMADKNKQRPKNVQTTFSWYYYYYNDNSDSFVKYPKTVTYRGGGGKRFLSSLFFFMVAVPIFSV